MGFRLYQHDFTILKPLSDTSTVRDVAASVTIDFYRRGAWANEAKTFTEGPIVGGTLNVIDPGDIVVGDTVQVGTSTTATRNVTAVAATVITLGTTGTGEMVVADGDRIVVINSDTASPPPYPRPRTYTDETGTEDTAAAGTAYQVTTDTKGEASCYTYNRVVDCIVDKDNATGAVLITDHGGTGGGNANGPEQWGALGDDSTDNIDAFNDLITRVDTVESGGIIEIPAGTFRLASTWTINTVAGLTIRGAGREQTTISINHTGTGIDFTGSCSDVTIEGLTIKRIDGTKTADQIQIGASCLRTSVRDLIFKNGGIAVDVQGDDTTISDCWFTGSDWVSFVRLNAAERPLLSNLTAISSGNWTRGIDIDTGVINPKLSNIHISSSDGVVSGTGIHIRDSGAGTDPRGTLISNCNISNGVAGVCVQIDAGESIIIDSTEISGAGTANCLRGVVIDGGAGVTLSSCIIVGCLNEAIDINATADVMITGLLSSEASQTSAGAASHIDIAANINDVMIIGARMGNFIRSGSTGAEYGIDINAGTSTGVIALAVRASNVTGGTTVFNGSTTNVNDISHMHNGSTLEHGPAGLNTLATTTLSGTEPTLDVRGISYVIFSQSGATDFTDFTNGTIGQQVSVSFANGNTTLKDRTTTGTFRLVGAIDWSTSVDNDGALFLYDGTDWIELSRSVN